MPTQDIAQVRELDRRDINALLARNFVGRLAFSRGDQIDVLPLSYVYVDGSIYGRTSEGGKLAAMSPSGTDVAFEVDEVQSRTSWRSVLVHGTLLLASADSGREEWMRALGAIRRLDRDALRDNDPAPHRSQIFRILVRDVTGRAMG